MQSFDVLGYAVVIIVLGICIFIYFRNEEIQLKCIVSTIDGNKYCVREREKVEQAADLLANVTEHMKDLVNYTYEKFPNKENVKRLYAGFNPKKIMETLPTSSFTAYSENKGEKLAFCLSNKGKKDTDHMIDEHTLTFVAIHELSHIATKSIGHKSEFWENFKFLLEQAKDAGIHDPTDYKKKPSNYCGMKIKDSPYFDV